MSHKGVSRCKQECWNTPGYWRSLGHALPCPNSWHRHSLDTSFINTNSNHRSLYCTHINIARHMAELNGDPLCISPLGLTYCSTKKIIVCTCSESNSPFSFFGKYDSEICLFFIWQSLIHKKSLFFVIGKIYVWNRGWDVAKVK